MGPATQFFAHRSQVGARVPQCCGWVVNMRLGGRGAPLGNALVRRVSSHPLPDLTPSSVCCSPASPLGRSTTPPDPLLQRRWGDPRPAGLGDSGHCLLETVLHQCPVEPRVDVMHLDPSPFLAPGRSPSTAAMCPRCQGGLANCLQAPFCGDLPRTVRRGSSQNGLRQGFYCPVREPNTPLTMERCERCRSPR